MGEHQVGVERPKGSLGLDLQQSGIANNPLFVTAPPAAPMAVDVTDRWARQLGQIDIARVLGAALAAGNPVITGIYDALGNRMPAMDAVARPGFVDPIDRATRLLGVAYGNLAQLQQKAATFELITEDTGYNTNPERYLQIWHWNTAAEIPIVAAGAGGQLNFGVAVAAGRTRRIREVTVRHTGSANTVVTIYDANGGNIILTIDCPTQSERTWSSQDGRAVAATLQPVIRTSDVTGGSTFVSAAGVEAPPT